MPNDHLPYSRRLFIQQGLTFVSLASTAPMFIQHGAAGSMLPLGSRVSSQAGVPDHRVLVVVQLAGGNDGLNTVVPYGSRDYYVRRPALAVREPGRGGTAALDVDGGAGIGLHPAMAPFKELMDAGVASIVQGVGYPNPNRSHFTSMDIWHTADTSGSGNGWIGRYFDCTCAGTPEPQGAVAIGRTAPLAMVGDVQKPVSFESADLFRWIGEDLHGALAEPYQTINREGDRAGVTGDSQLGFLLRTSLDAQVSSDRIRAAVARTPLVAYPGGSLSRQLQMVAAMIRAELSTRVYYVTLGGFDTHANQAGNHTNLLNQVARSLKAFYGDLQAQGNSGKILTMVFSEFGRRVGQNASGGTDHGTAAPMYFIGENLRPGLMGRHPSLTDLDNGDLKFNVDFRSIYASVLEDWMGTPSEPVLGKAYRKASLFRV